ncbi:MAG: mannose-1-phosphate guanylyltransferase [bacterium]|nr:MAG: mannose-1-phosphate guanylyltransferase [bacterium]
MDLKSDKNLYAVVIAGGRGKRFWPLSRNSKPKQLLALTGEISLLRQTVDRISGFIPKERTMVVTAKSHAGGVLDVLPDIPEKNILIEPEGKNTAPALSLAAAHIMSLQKDAVMVVLPSDHVIGEQNKFLDDIGAAVKASYEKGLLMTFGVRPTRPETGYGYIEVGEKVERGIFKVRSFKEKPNRKKAKDYVDSGRYLWNSGMFVFRCDVLMEKIQKHIPSLYSVWKTYSAGSKTDKDMAMFYNKAEAVSIDYGIMEKSSSDAAVIGASFNWSDVGSWQALDDLWEADEMGNRKNTSRVVSIKSQGNTIMSKKLVALLGVEDMIIVETDDALLVCKKECSQEIKSLVDEIERNGLKEFL